MRNICSRHKLTLMPSNVVSSMISFSISAFLLFILSNQKACWTGGKHICNSYHYTTILKIFERYDIAMRFAETMANICSVLVARSRRWHEYWSRSCTRAQAHCQNSHVRSDSMFLQQSEKILAIMRDTFHLHVVVVIRCWLFVISIFFFNMHFTMHTHVCMCNEHNEHRQMCIYYSYLWLHTSSAVRARQRRVQQKTKLETTEKETNK